MQSEYVYYNYQKESTSLKMKCNSHFIMYASFSVNILMLCLCKVIDSLRTNVIPFFFFNSEITLSFFFVPFYSLLSPFPNKKSNTLVKKQPTKQPKNHVYFRCCYPPITFGNRKFIHICLTYAIKSALLNTINTIRYPIKAH